MAQSYAPQIYTIHLPKHTCSAILIRVVLICLCVGAKSLMFIRGVLRTEYQSYCICAIPPLNWLKPASAREVPSWNGAGGGRFWVGRGRDVSGWWVAELWQEIQLIIIGTADYYVPCKEVEKKCRRLSENTIQIAAKAVGSREEVRRLNADFQRKEKEVYCEKHC